MDTRTAVWVSRAEKIFKIVLGEARNFSRKFRGVSTPALQKNPAVNFRFSRQIASDLQLRFWCTKPWPLAYLSSKKIVRGEERDTANAESSLAPADRRFAQAHLLISMPSSSFLSFFQRELNGTPAVLCSFSLILPFSLVARNSRVREHGFVLSLRIFLQFFVVFREPVSTYH